MKKISHEEFAAKYKGLHDSIFSGRLVNQHPFEHLDWEMVLVAGGIRIEENIFNALAKAAMKSGDSELIITDCEAPMVAPHQANYLLEWDYNSFRKLCKDSDLIGRVDTHLFGQSGEWGMVCYYDDFSCLGCAASFMDVFSAVLGGRNALKEMFFHYNTEGWFLDEDIKREILRSVGWGP
jgi:hypothetical protein